MVQKPARSLACALLAVLGSVPCAAQLVGDAAPVDPAAASAETPRASGDAAWTELDHALQTLDEAILQQLQWELWDQVVPTANEGLDAVARARAAGAPGPICVAVRETLSGLLDRQADIEAKAMAAEGEVIDDRALSAAAARLSYVEGQLPQTSFLRTESLFELARDDEAQRCLSRALVLWPANARLHDQARTWVDVFPDPERLANQLVARADRTGPADPDTGGIALETAGLLLRETANRLYAAEQGPEAAAVFERAVTLLQRSRSLPRSLPEGDVRTLSANAMVSAAYAHLLDAKLRWMRNGPDDPDAALSATAAEAALVRALEIDHENEEANQRAVLYVGDGLMTRNTDSAPRAQDFAEMRDFYGRMAKAFDVADWWNNYGFWCRETGTAAQERGDQERADELFEASFDAYQNAIRLEPDNARYVNDTGLMLFYHLGRDLDRAEALFKKAWELGREVCDNPFVDQVVYDENFSAYTDAMLNLARMYNIQGKYDQASAIIDELLALAPNRIDAQMTRREIEGARSAKADG